MPHTLCIGDTRVQVQRTTVIDRTEDFVDCATQVGREVLAIAPRGERPIVAERALGDRAGGPGGPIRLDKEDRHRRQPSNEEELEPEGARPGDGRGTHGV